ncbi:hypothetical protein PS15m_004614 [Mucor circinelloides]
MHGKITRTTLLVGILNRTVATEGIFAIKKKRSATNLLEPAPAVLSSPPALLSTAPAQPSPTPAHATCASSSDNYENDAGGKDKDHINGRSSTRRRLSSPATTALVVRPSEDSNFVANFNGFFISQEKATESYRKRNILDVSLRNRT